MSDTPGPHDALPPIHPMEEPPRMPPMPPAEARLEPEAPALRPIPFEDLEAIPGFWPRVGAMFRMVFNNPLELFDRVPVTAGIGAPWRFLLLLSIPIFLIAAMVFFFVGLGIMLAALEQSGKGDSKAVLAIMPVIFGVILLLMPLFAFLGMILGGMFSHFFLWMWGGLRPGAGMNQTVRAYGYASAFIQIGALIPYLGFLVQIAGMVVVGMGLARMHKTDTWRGVCAALTPLFLLCCCGILGIAAAVAIPSIMAAGH